MHFVIMGCGRVGARLALRLESIGHSVSVIDIDVNAFRRLGADFSGRTIQGVGFDHGILVKAGIREADGFAAVSSGDNSNILAARVVREKFGLSNVVARAYDERRAEVYERLGIPTVATVRWTAGQVLTRLLPDAIEPAWRDPSGRVALIELAVHPGWIGTSVTGIEQRVGIQIPVLNRNGMGMVPRGEMLLQAEDRVFVAVEGPRVPEVRAKLGLPPDRRGPDLSDEVN